MKANDLMLGDWVSSRGKKEKVTSIYDGFICTDSFEDSHDYFFEPIPLTAEILMANGFKKGSYVGGYYSELSPFRVYCDGKDECSFSTLFDDEIHFTCSYVHQLQHALRLCGVPDLADNFKV